MKRLSLLKDLSKTVDKHKRLNSFSFKTKDLALWGSFKPTYSTTIIEVKIEFNVKEDKMFLIIHPTQFDGFHGLPIKLPLADWKPLWEMLDKRISREVKIQSKDFKSLSKSLINVSKKLNENVKIGDRVYGIHFSYDKKFEEIFLTINPPNTSFPKGHLRFCNWIKIREKMEERE